MILTGACAFALLAWLGVLLRPSQSHRTRERLEAHEAGAQASELGAADLSGVTVLIPARNEAAVIERTLRALTRQGRNLRIVVVDDQSTDDTAAVCERFAAAASSGPASSVPCRSGFGRAHKDEDEDKDEEESRLEPLLQPLGPSSGGAPPAPSPPRASTGSTGAHAVAVTVVAGAPLPPGWGGKLWALEQGLRELDSPHTLLLDADIELAPGMLPALVRQARSRRAGLVSIMAALRSEGAWERLLAPPFVFFFKLLYPFAAVNDERRSTAAAAGGCMLVDTALLRDAGGFAPIRDALIDDCSLARVLKRSGASIWLGLSCSVKSHRSYPALGDFWRMVRRTAYTQLGYSVMLLVVTTVLMLTVFAAPVAGLALSSSMLTAGLSAAALLAMAAAYAPIVRFYALPVLWTFTLPVAAGLFLAMTWASAIRYWRGTRATWKNRAYEVPH
jgi:hopene-associated glycosyltransferase HpnB